MITGQVFFRETGSEAPIKDGRRLVSFVGIIAVPSGFRFLGEHQYIMTGSDDGKRLSLHDDMGVDLTEMAAGMSTGGMLMEPIWRF